MPNIHEFTTSTFLAGCSYDKENQVLTITFRNGKEYQYADVPENVYEEFKDAESAGVYYSAHIKTKYQAPKEKE